MQTKFVEVHSGEVVTECKTLADAMDTAEPGNDIFLAVYNTGPFGIGHDMSSGRKAKIGTHPNITSADYWNAYDSII